MKKFPIVPIIIMIAAFALSIMAARKVDEGRANLGYQYGGDLFYVDLVFYNCILCSNFKASTKISFSSS